MGEHSADFDKPSKRRKVISNFYDKIDRYECNPEPEVKVKTKKKM